MKTRLLSLLLVTVIYCMNNTIHAQQITNCFKAGNQEKTIQPAAIDQRTGTQMLELTIQKNDSRNLNANQTTSFSSEGITPETNLKTEFLATQTGTVTDIDGNVYQTVQIGDRWWMAENLRVTKYRNGNPIQDGTGIDTLAGIEEPKFFFYYDHDPANDSIYGKLYTWHVAVDERRLCPEGWYIPTQSDFTELQLTLDPDGGWENIAGGKMKTTGTIQDGTGLWNAPNVGATNESGFSGLPAGWFFPYGVNHTFAFLGNRLNMFSSTETNSNWAFWGLLWHDSESFGIGGNGQRNAAMSIRCIKNTTDNVQAPSVITLPAEDISQYSAVIKGEVTDDGGESVSNRGFYWGRNPNPSASDNRTYNGSGLGVFSFQLQNIKPSTTYYYKAFAKNGAGLTTGQERSFSTPAMDEETALSVASTAFLKYWQAIKQYNIAMTADVMADHSTVGWTNFAWVDTSKEPRIPWNNSPAYGDAAMTRDVWWSLYTLVSEINDVLYAIEEENLQIGPGGADNEKIKATMYLIRGLALGQIGLTFDQAWIAQDNADLESFEFSPWQQVMEAAIADLEQAIEICGANSFSWDGNVVNGMMITDTYMSQLASSYAARFLALGARNQDQNDDLSWSENYTWQDILDFANNGISTDFAPLGNGLPWAGGTWWDLNIKYLRQPGWGRVDCRVVNLLDPEYPVRYPTDEAGLPLSPPQVHPGLQPGEASSIDARFTNDFEFLPTNNFVAARGGWRFSHYRHSRYDYPPSTSTEGLYMGESLGPLRELRVYDNQLMKAEALARTGNVAGAAAILNDPGLPRKDRGNLPDVQASIDGVLHAIFYERDIELFHNGYLISFCDMRRRDMLQHGTPLHFPVPGAVLASLEFQNYTYGGHNNADGVNTSDGGAWIKPYYHFNNNTVTFIVSDDENPVEGAVISFEDYFALRTTDNNGVLVIELLDGNFTYSITKEGFVDYSDAFSIYGGDLTLYIELSPVSVEQIPEPSFRIFPNPFNDFIRVEANGLLSGIILRNILGQQKSFVNAEGKHSVIIRTNELSNGLYLIELHGINGDRSVRKLVK